MRKYLEITLLASQTLPNFKAFVTKEQQIEHFGSVLSAEIRGFYDPDKFKRYSSNDKRRRKNKITNGKR